MAGHNFVAATAEVALAAATAKTVLQIVPAANVGVRVNTLTVSFDGTSATNEPVVVVLMRQTTAGTASALTLVERQTTDPETLQTTAQHTATVEPSSADVIGRWNVHPQDRMQVTFSRALGNELICRGGERLGVVCTAPAIVNVIAVIEGEE